MPTQHIVVDGSNIATEGRSTPSLDQLEGAVTELHREFPDAEVTAVVDATFAHRIDPSELERYEKAALRGELISPPAGAIGRGDAFLLRIAEKVDAVVLSNDSFQEFHGEHPWLFDRGRLLGATPVPGVGWIFVPRTPVRGPKSRVAVRDAQRARARVEKAIAVATKEVERPSTESPRRARRTRVRAEPPQAVNDPMTFITFIAEHRLGEEIEAEVESFSSHGSVVRFGEVRGYIPLSGLGSPPPRSAREVLRKGDHRRFVVTALDPYRRGVELALPGVGVVSGRPSEETVAAEVKMARSGRAAPVPFISGPIPPPPGPRRRAAAAPAPEEAARGLVAETEAPAPRARRAAGTKATAAKTTKAAATKAAKATAAKTTKAAATKAAKATAAKTTKAAATKAAKATAAKTTKATAAKATAAKEPTPRTAKTTKATAAKATKAAATKATKAAKATAAKEPTPRTAKTTKATATKATAAKATKATAAKEPAPATGARKRAAKSADKGAGAAKTSSKRASAADGEAAKKSSGPRRARRATT
ncbi:MAG: S1 RNA-binding domain-containing protein [Actinomycetota bacterium]|nr:S1 RNA-binding domain-containing protein [Actinomycetota bacterium]